MELFFDTETTGILNWKMPLSDPKQPDIIQLAAILAEETEDGFKEHAVLSCLINPASVNPDWEMTQGAQDVHGFTRERIEAEGQPAVDVLSQFMGMWDLAETPICHNTQFDSRLVAIAHFRLQDPTTALKIMNAPYFCTMKKTTNLCKLPGKYGYKWPKLQELHQFLFGAEFEDAHDALADVRATARCFYELRRRGLA